MSKQRLIYIRIEPRGPPFGYQLALNLAGIVGGPAGRPGAPSNEVWILHDEAQDPAEEVRIAVREMNVPAENTVTWTSPTTRYAKNAGR